MPIDIDVDVPIDIDVPHQNQWTMDDREWNQDDIDIDDLCNSMQNAVLHFRIEEIEMDLQKIHKLYDSQKTTHVDTFLNERYRLSTELYSKHVYYHKSILASNTDIQEHELPLINSLYDLAHDNLYIRDTVAYLEKTRQFYIWLLDYIKENYDS